MKMFITAILLGWSIFGLAHAGSGKGVPTDLLPLKQERPQQLEVKKAVVAESPCEWVEEKPTTLFIPGQYGSIPGVYIQDCCCSIVQTQAISYATSANSIVSSGSSRVCKTPVDR